MKIRGVIKYLWLFFSLIFFCSLPATAEQKINLSPLFIQLSDAMSAVKENNTLQAKQDLNAIQEQFIAIEQHNSSAGKNVLLSLSDALNNTDIAHLNQLSIALLALDKEQHPLDIAQQKQRFKKRIVPVFEHWQQVVTENKMSPDIEQLKQQYRLFNGIWTKNERLVRDVDMAYYGKIETALALLRVAIETEPLDYQRIESNTAKIAAQFDDFVSGKKTEAVTTNYQLNDGINLLQEGLQAFEQQENATAQERLTTFIESWPSIEGEVSARNGSLYNKVESQLPMILA